MQQAIEEAKKMISMLEHRYSWDDCMRNISDYGVSMYKKSVLEELIERLERIPQKNSNIDISDEYYKNNPTSYWWVIWIINLPPTT